MNLLSKTYYLEGGYRGRIACFKSSEVKAGDLRFGIIPHITSTFRALFAGDNSYLPILRPALSTDSPMLLPHLGIS